MSKKIYWKGLEQLNEEADFLKYSEKEFPEKLPTQKELKETSNSTDSTRRDFLKLMGFSVAAVSMAACEAPVRKAIPYLNKPENIDPGIPNYYASTYFDGSDCIPVVVKTREGRPIFIEGNGFSSITKGGTNPRVNASVMMLYDNARAKSPYKKGKESSWEEVDKDIINGLNSISANGEALYVVSNSICSPSTDKVLKEFSEKYGAELVMYDQESASALTEANNILFGKAWVPSFDFSKAETIVSFGADFLANWINGVEFTAQYQQTRKVGKDKKDMSRHYQFESILSITGASADYRTPIDSSKIGLAILDLYEVLSGAKSKSSFENINKAAKDLRNTRGKSLVVCGINDLDLQLIVAKINSLLSNYDNTIDNSTPLYTKQGDDKRMVDFINKASSKQLSGVLFYNCNPVYDHPLGDKLAEGLKNVKLAISTADRMDETASLCGYLCPDSHFLESWNDAEQKKGHFSLCQPTIRTIFNTRQAQQSFLKWSGNSTDYSDYIKSFWEENLFETQNSTLDFTKFWQKGLHDGVYEVKNRSTLAHRDEKASDTIAPYDEGQVFSNIKKKYPSNSQEINLVVYSSNVIGTGNQANNPILQETPDPISKVCWGNYLSISPSLAKRYNLPKQVENKVPTIELSVNNKKYTVPAIVQPGQAENTVGIALGYGREGKNIGKVASQAAGVNAFMFTSIVDGFSALAHDRNKQFSLKPTGNLETVAQTQTHQTIMGRETIIQETTLPEYKANPRAGRYMPKIATGKGKVDPNDISLWDVSSDGYSEKGNHKEKAKKSSTQLLWHERVGIKADKHEYNNHHWGLVIDLNSCNGCSACVVACTIENNVPVVGKQEVINRREMHWIRIDRYYSNPSDANKNNYEDLAKTAENPEVVFQPMMCQHCNNAPCETVCPVAATTHSSEGLNQMTYNRCIGTKYCANNCPYKVRRFNWFKYHNNDEFDYHLNNDLGKMVLNPDVTVRSRGVMEKCSLCVQRIQSGKLKAKLEKREVKDTDVSTACASACPSKAIVFGDLNDTNSEIRQVMENELDERAYNVLEEINVNPNVWYMTKVRNKDKAEA